MNEWISSEWYSVRQLFRNTWILWIVPTIVAAAIGQWLSLTAVPVYEASTMVLILQRPGEDRPVDYASVLATKELMPTFEAMAQSNRVRSAAAAVLGEYWSPARLEASLRVSNPPDSVLLGIAVRCPRPEEALAAVKAVSSRFMLEVALSFPHVIAEPADDPVVTGTPVSPDPLLGPIAGALIGLALGGSAAVWLYQRRVYRRQQWRDTT